MMTDELIYPVIKLEEQEGAEEEPIVTPTFESLETQVIDLVGEDSGNRQNGVGEGDNATCFLCLNPCTDDDESDHEMSVGFVKFLSRYLEIDSHKVFQVSSASLETVALLKGADISVPLCQTCFEVADNFCDLYKQYDEIQLQLKVGINKMHELMLVAEEDPLLTRRHRQQLAVTKNPIEVIVDNLRTETIQQCYSLPKRSFPRVVLKEIQELALLRRDLPIPPRRRGRPVKFPPSMHDQMHISRSGLRVANQDIVAAEFLEGYTRLGVGHQESRKIYTSPAAQEQFKLFFPRQRKKKYTREYVPREQVTFSDIGGGNLSCNLCGKITAKKNATQHILTHTGERPFSCSHCGQGFRDSGNLRAHMFQHHRVYFFLKFKNPRLSTRQFEDHVTQLFKTIYLEESKVDQASLSCPFCERSYRKHVDVYAHMIHTHMEDLSTELVSLQKDSLEKGLPHEEDPPGISFIPAFDLTEPEAEGESDSLHSIEEILESREELPTFTNEKEKATSRSPRSDVEILKPLPLPKRGRPHAAVVKIPTNSKIPFHRLPGGRFSCGLCGKVFTGSNLQIHRRLHTGELPFPCKHCSERFRDAGNLRLHTLNFHRKELFQDYKAPNLSPDEFDDCIRYVILTSLKKLVVNGKLRKLCVFCKRKFSDSKAVEAHIVQFHFDELAKKLVEFQNNPQFDLQRVRLKRRLPGRPPKHPKKIVGSRYESVIPVSNMCAICGASFENPALLNRHVMLEHKDSNNSSSDHAMGQEVDMRHTVIRHKLSNFIFGRQPAASGRHSVLKKMLMKNSNRINPGTKNAVKEFIQRKHKESFTCTYCGKPFKFFQSHRIHLLTEHRNPFIAKYLSENGSITEAEIDTVLPAILQQCMKLPGIPGGQGECQFCFKQYTFEGSESDIAEMENHLLVVHFHNVVQKLKEEFFQEQDMTGEVDENEISELPESVECRGGFVKREFMETEQPAEDSDILGNPLANF